MAGDLSKIPPFNVCIGKPIKTREGERPRFKFVTIGVGWPTNNGEGIRCQLDLTLILSPEDNLLLLPNRNHPDHKDKRQGADAGSDFGKPEAPF